MYVCVCILLTPVHINVQEEPVDMTETERLLWKAMPPDQRLKWEGTYVCVFVYVCVCVCVCVCMCVCVCVCMYVHKRNVFFVYDLHENETCHT